MKQVPKYALNQLLKEMVDMDATEQIALPVQFVRDIVNEVKVLRHKVSQPRKREVNNEG